MAIECRRGEVLPFARFVIAMNVRLNRNWFDVCSYQHGPKARVRVLWLCRRLASGRNIRSAFNLQLARQD